ncbi:MAG: ABC transporter ATP-binding protein [Crocinitomicaceae bacterium]|nr:ABC transporter ATP-binding protein [Crocinitomicaceae bacterium]
MKGFVQIFKLAFTYKRTAVAVIIFNFLFAIFNLLSLVLFVPFLELIFKEEKNGELETIVKPDWDTSKGAIDYFSDYFEYMQATFIKTHGEAGALAFICIAVLVAFLLKNLFRYGAIWHQSYLRMAVVRDLRKQLFGKAIHLPLAYYSEEKKGNLLARMTADLNEIEIAVVYILEIIFREPISIIIALSVLFYWSTELTLFSLILMPVSAFFISRIGKSLKRTSAKGQQQMGQVLSVIEESLGGVRIIKAFNAEKTAQKRLEKENDHHQNLMTRAFRKKELASPLNEFLGAAVLISIVWFGGKIILEKGGGTSAMTGDEFIAFIIVFSQLLRPVSGIASGLAATSKGSASIDRINEILDLTEQIQDPKNPVQKNSFDRTVEFDHVVFAYADEPVLKNISFKLDKGKTIALVGESGSGKSTISDLIPRFYDVKSGAVKIDDVNVKDMTKKDLRELISVVTQESILFNDSIHNNIAFGKPDATEEEIIAAAKIANAHEFISSFENGYDTNIGDRGNKLSGGQKQRLSIARAVLTNAPIMILDEATSALDTESEKLVQDALDRLMKNRTSLVIAHRLSTIKNADQIIVLKKGEIVEQGTHAELIAANGYYKSLCDIQAVI